MKEVEERSKTRRKISSEPHESDRVPAAILTSSIYLSFHFMLVPFSRLRLILTFLFIILLLLLVYDREVQALQTLIFSVKIRVKIQSFSGAFRCKVRLGFQQSDGIFLSSFAVIGVLFI